MSNEKKTMTAEETMAENARLEQELRRMTEENGRLHSELVAARKKVEDAENRWHSELQKVKKKEFSNLSDLDETLQLDINIPGVLTMKIRGRDAFRALGLEVRECNDRNDGG